MQMGVRRDRAASARDLGPLRRELAGDAFERLASRDAAVQIGMIRRAAVAGTVDDIDAVSFFEQHRRPAAAAVNSAHPIEPRALLRRGSARWERDA